MSFKASAPGSLMLLGEHAVLHGYPAVVCAIDKRIQVTLTPARHDQLEIFAHKYGQWQCGLSELSITAPFQFVTACLYRYRKHLPTGCRLDIHSEFSDQIGLGSSAAVTVATLAALLTWLKIDFSSQELIRKARQVIRMVQGVGSGADVAASVLGGVVAYQPRPLVAEVLASALPLMVVYSGSKTPTVEVIKKVSEYFLPFPDLYTACYRAIGACAQAGIHILRQSNHQHLGRILDIQQGLMVSLGVSNPSLNNLVLLLKTYPTILGAKISGSGLGDCVIALGEVPADTIKQLAVKIAKNGVIVDEKI